MSRSRSTIAQEIEFVAGALTHAHALQNLLDIPGRWTAEVRRDAHALLGAFTGHMLVADFALTGDEEGVANTMHTIHDEVMMRLAA